MGPSRPRRTVRKFLALWLAYPLASPPFCSMALFSSISKHVTIWLSSDFFLCTDRMPLFASCLCSYLLYRSFGWRFDWFSLWHLMYERGDGVHSRQASAKELGRREYYNITIVPVDQYELWRVYMEVTDTWYSPSRLDQYKRFTRK